MRENRYRKNKDKERWMNNGKTLTNTVIQKISENNGEIRRDSKMEIHLKCNGKGKDSIEGASNTVVRRCNCSKNGEKKHPE